MVHNNLGSAYATQKSYDLAIAEYQAALRLNPNYEDVHNNLGVVYGNQGRSDMAIFEYKSAIWLDPDFAAILTLGMNTQLWVYPIRPLQNTKQHCG